MKVLTVAVSDVSVGNLVQDRHEGHVFRPEPAWLDGNQRPLLGLHYRQSLGQSGPSLSSSHLPEWFENLLPEQDSELRRLLGDRLGLRQGQSFALLGALGGDLPGAVVVGGASDDDGFPEPVNQTESQDDLRLSALAGVHLKFSMARSGTRFTLPAHRGDDLWIVKIPQADIPLLPQIECVTMQWARSAGLTVPDCEVVAASQLFGLDAFVRQGIADVFAIRRYDRSTDGSRTHQEDFAQVLNLMPRHKYGDSGPLRASLVAVGRIIRDAAADGAVEDFLRRVAFVIASGNTDAHLKNWSFIYHGNDVIPSMAPCYDLVSTIACDVDRFGWGLTKGPTLALGLGATKLFSAVSRAAVSDFIRRLALPRPEAALQTILEAISQFRFVWSGVAADAPDILKSALREHWRRTPILAELESDLPW